jgi:hypothetical protein
VYQHPTSQSAKCRIRSQHPEKLTHSQRAWQHAASIVTQSFRFPSSKSSGFQERPSDSNDDFSSSEIAGDALGHSNMEAFPSCCVGKSAGPKCHQNLSPEVKSTLRNSLELRTALNFPAVACNCRPPANVRERQWLNG